MHPNAFHAQQLEASRLQSEAIARIEAEQARQGEVLATIVGRLDELAAERPKRSSTKP